MKIIIPNEYTKEEVLNNLLVKNKKLQSHRLKLLLYKFNIKEEKCEECGICSTWNGKKLSLHLDHIDGVHTNNEIDNLRILCPNCHSQTDTYAGKKNKKTKEQKLIDLDNHCTSCDSLISKGASMCKSCSAIEKANNKRSFTLPSKEELLKMLISTSFSEVGRNFNVTGNAVKKWCEKYNMSPYAKDYK